MNVSKSRRRKMRPSETQCYSADAVYGPDNPGVGPVLLKSHKCTLCGSASCAGVGGWAKGAVMGLCLAGAFVMMLFTSIRSSAPVATFCGIREGEGRGGLTIGGAWGTGCYPCSVCGRTSADMAYQSPHRHWTSDGDPEDIKLQNR